ncbi:MAG: TIGR04283 family arsenosugar biosynthesis glycosyltransferase [Nitrospinales bacterium]
MKVSVIIPTLNESATLADTIAKVRDFSPFEILVGDGGSSDTTVEIAIHSGANVIQCEKGRAIQMNGAAQKAEGDLLLFLHADTILEPKGYAQMCKAMDNNEIVGGAFSLQLDSERTFFKVISRLATWRSRYLNLVYGDQAIFVRKDKFHDIGEFPNLPICEDLEFYSLLVKNGKTIVLKEKAYTSARRWHTEGAIFTTCRNILIAIMFMSGFPPKIMARWYGVVR